METDISKFVALDTHILGRGDGAPNVFSGDFDYELGRYMAHQTYGGAEYAEGLVTARRVVDTDRSSWTNAWTTMAQQIEDLATSALKGGHRVSAREAFLRATTYWQCALFHLSADDEKKPAIFDRHVNCFRAAGELFDPPFETIEIPYEDGHLPGYFFRPDLDDRKRPTVLIQGGGDTTSEQLYFSGGAAAALRRGYNALCFDGPGQWGAYIRNPESFYRYDWEVPVGAVVDYALSRSEVDPERIALIGYSYGGHLITRAACFEKRLGAAIALPIIPDPKTGSSQILEKGAGIGEMLKLDWFVRHGLQYGPNIAEDAKALFDQFSVWDYADQITCPFLNISTSGEGKLVLEDVRNFMDRMKGPKYFVGSDESDGAEFHCMANNLSLLHMVEFDWLDDVFGVAGGAS